MQAAWRRENNTKQVFLLWLAVWEHSLSLRLRETQGWIWAVCVEVCSLSSLFLKWSARRKHLSYTGLLWKLVLWLKHAGELPCWQKGEWWGCTFAVENRQRNTKATFAAYASIVFCALLFWFGTYSCRINFWRGSGAHVYVLWWAILHHIHGYPTYLYLIDTWIDTGDVYGFCASIITPAQDVMHKFHRYDLEQGLANCWMSLDTLQCLFFTKKG